MVLLSEITIAVIFSTFQLWKVERKQSKQRKQNSVNKVKNQRDRERKQFFIGKHKMVIAEEKRMNKVVNSTVNCIRYYTYLISH